MEQMMFLSGRMPQHILFIDHVYRSSTRETLLSLASRSEFFVVGSLSADRSPRLYRSVAMASKD